MCLRHLQPNFGIAELTERQCREFLVKWHKRTQFTWQDLVQHDRHGLGWEFLPRGAFRPAVPESLSKEKFMVFRHEGNLPFAGFRAGEVFHVLWIAASYSDLYDHG